MGPLARVVSQPADPRPGPIPHPDGAPMSLLGVLRSPRQVMFGAGQRHALGTIVSALGSRALVCTDARFGSTPEFAQLVRLLEDSGVQVTAYAEVEPDVPVHQVIECAELASA